MNLSNRCLVLAVFCVQLAVVGAELTVEQEAIQQKWAYVKTIIPDKAVLDFKTAWLNKVLYPGLCVAFGGSFFMDGFLVLAAKNNSLTLSSLRWIMSKCDGENEDFETLLYSICSIFTIACIINIFNNRSLPGITFNKQSRQTAISSSARTLLCVNPDYLPDEVASIVKKYKEAGSSDEEKLVSDVAAVMTGKG